MEDPVEIKLNFNIKLNKVIFLGLIQKKIGKGELWFGELKHFMADLKPEIREQFGLYYKEGSLYRFLDQLAEQGLILKYQKKEPNIYLYFRISKQGLQIIEKMEGFFEKKQKIKEKLTIMQKENLFDDSEKMELINQITLILGEKFFENLYEISEKENKKIAGAANSIVRKMERFL